MKNTKSTVSLFALCLLVLAGCRQESSSDSYTSDEQTDTLESAVTMIAGQADDANGSSFALQTKSGAWKYAMIDSLVNGASANAANCGRAYDQACNVGVKTVSYADCSIAARGFSLSGSVTLTYSNNSCSLSGNGDYVTRTYNHTISGPRGGAIQTTSDLHTNYLGSQIGGGGRLTHVSGTNWTIAINGKSKIGTRNGRTLFDVSAHTTTPIQVSSTLSRAGRTISAGAIAVDHNVAKFTATYTANASQPLVWSTTCCHPISGRLDAAYTGSISGSGTITFNGCGSAELSKDGSTRTLSLGYCE